jgi:hypothetical protein
MNFLEITAPNVRRMARFISWTLGVFSITVRLHPFSTWIHATRTTRVHPTFTPTSTVQITFYPEVITCIVMRPGAPMVKMFLQPLLSLEIAMRQNAQEYTP